MNREKHSIDRVWYHLLFQASGGRLGMYSLWVKGGYSITVRLVPKTSRPHVFLMWVPSFPTPLADPHLPLHLHIFALSLFCYFLALIQLLRPLFHPQTVIPSGLCICNESPLGKTPPGLHYTPGLFLYTLWLWEVSLLLVWDLRVMKGAFPHQVSEI